MGSLSRVTAGMILITATLVAGSMSALALLKKGTDGPAVEVIQKKLKIKADGDFGDKTEDAVRAFQKKRGLPQDGKVGEETWRKLMGNTPGPTLAEGIKKPKSVKKLQRLLKLKQDGKFGPATTSAVKRYQQSKGIVDKGTVESDTRFMLGWGR
jgi:peptidoglycan hydrolase-like protein with peptidoglycan-binding domain